MAIISNLINPILIDIKIMIIPFPDNKLLNINIMESKFYKINIIIVVIKMHSNFLMEWCNMPLWVLRLKCLLTCQWCQLSTCQWASHHTLNQWCPWGNRCTWTQVNSSFNKKCFLVMQGNYNPNPYEGGLMRNYSQ